MLVDRKGSNMSLPPEYESQFLVQISKRSNARNTLKTYKSMFRRMSRCLDVEDLSNPAMIYQYRLTMPEGSFGIFHAVFGILRQTPIGSTLPPIDQLVAVKYPHPLYADVMTLGAIFNNERLPELTWGDVLSDERFDKSALKAARRTFHWHMGEDASPTAETPLVPKDGTGKPAQLWQIESIINSTALNKNLGSRDPKKKIAAFLTDVIGLFVSRGIRACDLRRYYLKILAIGNHAKVFQFPLALEDLRAARTLEQVDEIIGSFPEDPITKVVNRWG